MSLRKWIAASTLAAACVVAAGPALAECDASTGPVGAACIAREVAEIGREAKNPMMQVRFYAAAARLLPMAEAAPLLGEARKAAGAIPEAGNRTMALMEIAGTMSDRGMPEGQALGRALATRIFEEGANDSMMIQVLGKEAAAAEQIKQIARFQAMNGDLEGAQIAIGYQPREADKVDSMFAVAATLSDRGDHKAADSMLRQAMRRLAGVANPKDADHVKLGAVDALARAGWTDEALALAQTTATITARVEAIGIVVQRLAEAGNVAGARKQYERIAGLSANDSALWALAKAVAEAGDMKKARAMLHDMQIPLMRDQAIADLAAVQAGQGDLNGALDIVADLPQGFERDRGLREVLMALVDNGRLREAEDYAAGLPDQGLRNMVLAPIAAARARAGDVAQALATARAQPTPDARASILLAVAGALAEGKAKTAD
jgi:tetratricopeptide (TPR) repeat protein